MQFCYCNGISTGRYAILVGVLIGSHNRHLTSYSWKQFLDVCTEPTANLRQDFHVDGRSHYDIWKALYSDKEDSPIECVLDWFLDYRIPVLFGVVDRTHFARRTAAGEIPREVGDEWTALGLQLSLTIEKIFRDTPIEERSTLFVFDEGLRKKIRRFEHLVSDAPTWANAFYSKSDSYPGLAHVVPAPLFSRPKDAPLIQVPYLLANVIRRYIEMQEDETMGTSVTEVQRVHRWFDQLADRCLAYPYPTEDRAGATGLFRALAPQAVRRNDAPAKAADRDMPRTMMDSDVRGHSGAA